AWIRKTAKGVLHAGRYDGPPPRESFAQESMERILTDFSGAPGCWLYLARRGATIAGGGAVRIVDGLAQLAGAATLPTHRRSGVDSALLRARLVGAPAAGRPPAVATSDPPSEWPGAVPPAGRDPLYVPTG